MDRVIIEDTGDWNNFLQSTRHELGNVGSLGPEILVDRNHPVDVIRLNWGEESTWSYQSGNLVKISGYITIAEEWQLRGPGGIMIRLKPSEIDIQEHANSSLHNVF